MDKLTLAHSYALLHMTIPQYKDVDDLDLVGWAFDYAEAMLAEDEKRKDKSLPEVLMGVNQTFIDGVEQTRYAPDRFVIDWDCVSERYNYWVMDKDGRCFWYEREPRRDDMEFYQNCDICLAPDFGYKGDWKQSLRKRPE